MKRLIIGATIALAATAAHAGSWFEFEAGIGASHVSDMGDGTWIQRGAPNNREQQNSPAFLAGITGQIAQRGAWDARWHLDYTYIGTYTASVDGVPDQNYDPVSHKVHNWSGAQRYSPFNGGGHTQGIPLTLDVGYTWHGYRLGAEVGAWAYRQSWHESLYDLTDQDVHFIRAPKTQFGYVAGVRLDRGAFGVSYRYYQIRADWSGNGVPGLATGAHVLMLTYKW